MRCRSSTRARGYSSSCAALRRRESEPSTNGELDPYIRYGLGHRRYRSLIAVGDASRHRDWRDRHEVGDEVREDGVVPVVVALERPQLEAYTEVEVRGQHIDVIAELGLATVA